MDSSKEYKERINDPSKMLLILDFNMRGTEVSNVPQTLVGLYLDEMELHAEEVFKVKMRDDWEEEIFYDDAGKPFIMGPNVVLYISTNKYKEDKGDEN